LRLKTKDDFSTLSLPDGKVRPKLRLSPIWLVPVVAAIVAGWLVFENVRNAGPLITIQLDDGAEVQANQTTIRYRGVKVGSVRSIKLTADEKHVEVRARLDESAKNLARDGSIFWVVRTEVGASGLHGLDTIVSGPYIQVQPGSGKEQTHFIGADDPPVVDTGEGGLEIIVTTPELGTLNVGSPVYYRGMEAGSVKYFVLSEDSTSVEVHLLIKTNFTRLVRTDSKFWNAGGININLRFLGINISAESFKSLVIGGIPFATPPTAGPLATNRTVFSLNEKVDEKWLKWSPAISITNAQTHSVQSPPSSILLNSMNPGAR
jgi:paraquat-inducible protein B